MIQFDLKILLQNIWKLCFGGIKLNTRFYKVHITSFGMKLGRKVLLCTDQHIKMNIEYFVCV